MLSVQSHTFPTRLSSDLWLLVPARASSSVLLTGNRRRFSNGFQSKADRWMAGGIFAGRRNDIITRPEIRTAALPGQPIGKRTGPHDQHRNRFYHWLLRHESRRTLQIRKAQGGGSGCQV